MAATEVIKEVKATTIITKQFIEAHLYLLQWYLLFRLAVASSMLTGITHFRRDVFGDINQVGIGWAVLAVVIIGIFGMLRGRFWMNFIFACGAFFFSLFMASKYIFMAKFDEIMLYLFVVDVGFCFWLKVRLLWAKARGQL